MLKRPLLTLGKSGDYMLCRNIPILCDPLAYLETLNKRSKTFKVSRINLKSSYFYLLHAGSSIQHFKSCCAKESPSLLVLLTLVMFSSYEGVERPSFHSPIQSGATFLRSVGALRWQTRGVGCPLSSKAKKAGCRERGTFLRRLQIGFLHLSNAFVGSAVPLLQTPASRKSQKSQWLPIFVGGKRRACTLPVTYSLRKP